MEAIGTAPPDLGQEMLAKLLFLGEKDEAWFIFSHL
jgi:hypothetical protein